MGKNDKSGSAFKQRALQLEDVVEDIKPDASWEDITLGQTGLSQLRDICNQARQMDRTFREKRSDRSPLQGKGLNILFSGPLGSGKTLAAKVIASESGTLLYRVDLSKVVSKYIGETERNLSRIFSAAHASNAILLFDESDALFGNRTNVSDAHDRYANIDLGYLLQRLEEYEGIAILATNVRQTDDAFKRRFRYILEFPSPGNDRRGNLCAFLRRWLMKGRRKS